MDAALKEHALLQESFSLSLPPPPSLSLSLSRHDGVIKFWILKTSKRYAFIANSVPETCRCIKFVKITCPLFAKEDPLAVYGINISCKLVKILPTRNFAVFGQARASIAEATVDFVSRGRRERRLKFQREKSKRRRSRGQFARKCERTSARRYFGERHARVFAFSARMASRKLQQQDYKLRSFTLTL